SCSETIVTSAFVSRLPTGWSDPVAGQDSNLQNPKHLDVTHQNDGGRKLNIVMRILSLCFSIFLSHMFLSALHFKRLTRRCGTKRF
ncbi:MAG: hypothetical protein ACKV2Q_29465, partial [Planctomycetaceae bacterium]